MRTPGLLIFDLDGTLVDSQKSILDSIQHALTELKLDHFEIDEVRSTQQDLATTLREASARHSHVLDEATLQKFIQVYRAHHSHEAHLKMWEYPGVTELLSELRQRGFQLAVATTKHTAQAVHVLSSLKLDHFFDHIQGTDPGLRYKPAPDILNAVMKRLDFSQNAPIAYVGDAAHDMEAAHAAGLGAIGAAYGFAGRDGLHPADRPEIHPHIVIHEPIELLGVSSRLSAK